MNTQQSNSERIDYLEAQMDAIRGYSYKTCAKRGEKSADYIRGEAFLKAMGIDLNVWPIGLVAKARKVLDMWRFLRDNLDNPLANYESIHAAWGALNVIEYHIWEKDSELMDEIHHIAEAV